MTPNRAACRTCQAPIYWATTGRGRLIPLDPPPPGGHPDGNLFAWLDTNLGELRADPWAGQTRPGGLRCVAHFTSCPDADAHRRPR